VVILPHLEFNGFIAEKTLTHFIGGIFMENLNVPQAALEFHGAKFSAKVRNAKLDMVAYSGKIIKGHWYWDDLALDLKGVKFAQTKFPILENHNTDKKIAFTGKPLVNGNLRINPDTTKFVDTPESARFQRVSKDGFPYQASVRGRPTAVERLTKGESAEVNGLTIKGPASIWRKWEFVEASVCVFGWDSNTKAAMAQSENTLSLNSCSLGLTEKDAAYYAERLQDEKIVDDLLRKCGLKGPEREAEEPLCVEDQLAYTDLVKGPDGDPDDDGMSSEEEDLVNMLFSKSGSLQQNQLNGGE